MTIVEGIAFAAVGVLPTFWLTVSVLFVLGIGVAYVEDVALPTFIQLSVPRAYLGRINSIIEMPRVLLEPVSLAITGVLVGIGVRWGFFYASVPMLVAGIGLLLSRSARQLRPPTPPAPEPPEPGAPIRLAERHD